MHGDQLLHHGLTKRIRLLIVIGDWDRSRISRRRYKEMCAALKNRRELVAAGLTSRRDLMKMGLLTAGGTATLLHFTQLPEQASLFV
jgi:hypothetical protein